MLMLILKNQTCLPWQMLEHSQVPMINEVNGKIIAKVTGYSQNCWLAKLLIELSDTSWQWG